MQRYVVPELAGSLPLIQCHPPARIRVGRGKRGGLGEGQVGQVVTHLSRRLRAAFDMPASV